ncbi:DUF2786 domain-containing protein [Streptosporangium lutulentum]|uniref:Type II secretory pathway component GspD/PulD (Secretin) n=1 Tax=Streptosporangium lutulentum TaxID=1461250 RepID=A0ABT9QAD4_9ACTN|nr:DUF2786 domain-containing protein [Streptosporangium lutulentum]MDP9843336.1 type II secretory pathway component GspD/PulD (secretin) [Streptosporangium lutulentum]
MTDAPAAKLELIRKLLAVAEHPGTPAIEAETYRERAYALMAKFGVERAHLAAAGEITDELASIPLIIDKTHQAERCALLSAIASAKHCRTLLWKLDGKTYVMVSGYQSDLDAVQMLYASLALQMAKEVATVTPAGRKGLATARKSFMAGFASRVGEKLRDAEKAATVETTHVAGRSTDLVLRDRDAAVSDYFDRMTPNAGSVKRQKVGDTSAYFAGREAGDRADLGGSNRNRVGTGQRALNA